MSKALPFTTLLTSVSVALFAPSCNKEEKADSAEQSEEKNKAQGSGEKEPGKKASTENAEAPTKTATPMPSEKVPSTPSVEYKSFDLEGLDYAVDAPAIWPFAKLGEGVFRFKLKAVTSKSGPSIMPSLIISKSPMGPTNEDEVKKRCRGELVASGSKGELIFHNCKAEMAGQEILTSEYFAKLSDGFLSCVASGLDFETMNRVCSSLRKI